MAPKVKTTLDDNQAQADFCRYFIEQDFKNATGAYKRAYPNASDQTAAVESSRFLKNPKIQEQLSIELSAVLKEKRIPLEKRILDTWMVRAFYDIAHIVNEKGELLASMEELREQGLSVVIDGVDIKTGNKGQAYTVYKLADRDKALDMLQRYIQMIRPIDQTINVNVLEIGKPPSLEDAKFPE